MNGESLHIQEDNLHKLKELFPDVFSEDKLDWEKLKATFSDDINFANERYVLNWAGKGDAFKTLQIPTTATLKPAPEESINFDTTQNVFIEGENLEVLKVLQKSYYGKIKCIIIDPPYNTGNDSFIYPDSFKENKADYEKRVGDKDEEGYLMKEGLFRKNSKDNGHYHSNWLSMMYPRLFLAKNLLRDDGVIFVHIDDNEVHNLRLLMNEIFGEENALGTIVRSTGQTTGQDSGGLGSSFDYIIAFSKQPNLDLSGLKLNEHDLKRFENEDENGKYAFDQMRKTGSSDKREDRPNMWYGIMDPDGNVVYPIAPAGYEGRWRFEEKSYKKLKDDNYILWKKSKRDNKEIWWPYVKYYLEGRTKRPSPLWTDLEGNKKAARDLREIFEGIKLFDFPKPIQLIKRLIQIIPNPDKEDIILDFFAGSATTAQAVLEQNKENGLNHKFILVQLPELTDKNSEAYKAGYKTIADISKERIRRVIKKIEKEKAEGDKKKKSELKFGNHGNQDNQKNQGLDNGFKVFKLSSSNFKIWRGNEITEDNLVQQLEVFTNPVSEGSLEENMLYELMLKAGYQLTDKVEATNVLWDNFNAGGEINCYSIADNELIIILDGIDESTVLAVINAHPKKVITLDSLFTGNDQLKTNTVLQMRDSGVEFKTI